MLRSHHFLARPVLAVVVAAVASCVWSASLHAQASPAAENPLGPATIGQPHPPLELEVIDGSLVNQARMAGRPFVLTVFATWCQPCHRALADLLLVRAEGGGDPIPVVLLNLGQPPDVVSRWARRAALPADLLVTVDPSGIASRRWGARRLPTTFLVDARGVVRHINRGWGAGYQVRLSRWLRELPARP